MKITEEEEENINSDATLEERTMIVKMESLINACVTPVKEIKNLFNENKVKSHNLVPM